MMFASDLEVKKNWGDRRQSSTSIRIKNIKANTRTHFFVEEARLLKRRLLSRTNRKWEENLTRLIAYRDARDGDCNVPQSYKKDPQLGIWVMTQKKNLRRYKVNPVESRLSADQVAKLQEIGAITSWSSTAHRRWEDNLMRLIAYRDKHNGCVATYLGSGRKTTSLPIGLSFIRQSFVSTRKIRRHHN